MKKIQLSGFLGKYIKQILFLVVVVVAWTALSPRLLRGGTELRMDYLDVRIRLEVTGAEEPYMSEIPYAVIQKVETAYTLDLGSMVTGVQNRSLWFGVWTNEAYGEYSLYVMPSLDTYCVITAENRVYVLNIQTKADTESFTVALRQLLEDKGFPLSI